MNYVKIYIKEKENIFYIIVLSNEINYGSLWIWWKIFVFNEIQIMQNKINFFL